MASAESGGPAEQINYFPQNPTYNQPGTPGTWRKMEVYLQKLKIDNPSNTYRLEITPVFSGKSKRPEKFYVEIYNSDELIDIPSQFIEIPNPL